MAQQLFLDSPCFDLKHILLVKGLLETFYISISDKTLVVLNYAIHFNSQKYKYMCRQSYHSISPILSKKQKKNMQHSLLYFPQNQNKLELKSFTIMSLLNLQVDLTDRIRYRKKQDTQIEKQLREQDEKSPKQLSKLVCLSLEK